MNASASAPARAAYWWPECNAPGTTTSGGPPAPFHNFADWLMFGGKLIGHNDPDYQEKIIKFNELLANCAIYSTACDITDAAIAIAAEGRPVDLDDLATISPYITHVIRRFGSWILNLVPPAAAPTTHLDLDSRVLFAP